MTRDYWLQVAFRLQERCRREPKRKVELLLKMTDAYLKANYYKAALMVCRSILKIEPFNVQAMVRLGRCLLGQKEFRAAQKLYSSLTDLVSSLDEGWWGLWAAYKGQNEHEKAAMAVEHLLKANPNEQRALRQAADDRQAAGQTSLAIKHLENLFEQCEDKAAVAGRLARLLLTCTEKARALHYLEVALDEERAQPALLLLAADTAFSLRDWKKAAALATERLEAGTFSCRALELLGRSRLELDEFDGAILSLERLVDKAPDNFSYRLVLAEALYRAGELRDAEVELNRCLARSPQQPQVVLRLGEIAWRKKERQKAETLYERCLRLNPGSTLALYRLGVLKFERHLYPAALTCFRRLMVAQPENIKAHLYLGRCLRITGAFDRAKNHLTRACELAPASAEAEFELGLLNMELHRTTLAREHFERATVLGGEGEWGKRAAYELAHLGKQKVRPLAVGESAPPSRSAKGKARRWIKLC